MVHQKTFDISTKLEIPEKLKEYSVNGKTVIIAPEMATWIVLNTDAEKECFDLIQKGNTLKNILQKLTKKYGEEKAIDILKKVLTEIEVKEFYKSTKTSKAEFRGNKIAILFLTFGCNLRCKHCYLKCSEPLDNELDTKEWRRLLREFSEVGGKYVTLTGGEVLTKKDLFMDVLDHAYNLGFKIQVYTNGTLLTPEIVDEIAKKAYEVQISIDGPNEDTHDKIRGKGTFKRILDALAYFKDKDIRISIAMTPLPETLPIFEKELSSFVSKIREIVGKDIIVRLAPEIIEGREVNPIIGSEASEFRRRVHKLFDEIYYKGFIYSLDTAHFIPHVKHINCGYANSLKVLPNGDVVTCETIPTRISKIANIKETSLRDIINKLKEIYYKTSVDYMTPCKDCELKYFCGGGCKYNNLLHNGDVLIANCDKNTKQEILYRLIQVNNWIYERR